MATLEQQDKIMLLNPNPGYHGDILTGPLTIITRSSPFAAINRVIL